MLFWLAQAAREARNAAGRRQVHVAASTIKGVDQSTIARFEKHTAWPRDPDATIRAYADDLDVAPVELWSAALEMWRAFEAMPPDEKARRLAELEAQRTNGQRQAPRTTQRAGRRDSRGR